MSQPLTANRQPQTKGKKRYNRTVNILSIIAARRDRGIHSEADFRFLADGSASGSIPDYQLSAWLMAAVLNPLTVEETALLTVAMAESGERLSLEALPKPWVDKHSTGGIGDKTTIALLPLLASCGLTMVKMSGAGLGITGGTVDKLQSIPGFRVDLSPNEMLAQAKRIGIALTGQTPKLAPADKALYALRDVTGTVKSVPLIASSILSKKLAGGAETVVIDLKVGCGGFMKTIEEARELADTLLAVANKCGLNLRIAMTDMDSPLGYAVGNALEVREAISILQGKVENRFSELCYQLAGFTFHAVGKASTLNEGVLMAKDSVQSGRAYEKAMEWFAAQGANPSNFLELLPTATVQQEVCWEGEPGIVSQVRADVIGQTVLDLGGGRKQKGGRINYSVGVVLAIEPGNQVSTGQPIATIHANSMNEAKFAGEVVQSAIQIGEPLNSNPILKLL